jgi:ubiquinone/menaquinone biosynthesis C-methylase UbiE
MIERNVRTTAAVRSDYDNNSNHYDQERFGSCGGRYVDSEEREFVRGKIKGSSVLEIGTATGRFAASLNEHTDVYVGVDLSLRMLQKTLERTNHSVSVVQMDGSELGVRSYFDDVLCIRTFHFLDKPRRALEGIFNSLKPGGHCLVTFESDNALRRLLLSLGAGGSEQYYYTIPDVQALLLKAGFKVAMSGSVMRVPVSFYRRCPGRLLPLLKRVEAIWFLPMHNYVLGVK